MPQFGSSEKCTVCSKTVYVAEKIVVEDKEDKKIFHKSCLKCSHCSRVLSLGNYASMNGVFYCKPHFKQLFATKGNYNEGFGMDKLTSKWAPQANVAPSSFVPVTSTDSPKSSSPAAEKAPAPAKLASASSSSSLSSPLSAHATSESSSTSSPSTARDENKTSSSGSSSVSAAASAYENKTTSESKSSPKPSLVESRSSPKTSESNTSTSRFGKTNVDKCHACSKTVYATEKIVIEEKDEKKNFHKNCLKCSHCNVVLSLGNYASLQGVIYCKPHFKQLFAAKGNYDEGFGKEKHDKKWEPSVNTAPNSFVPVDKDEKRAAPKTEAPSNIAKKFSSNTSAADKCQACGKTVYATERIVVEDKEDKKAYHKTCLKCHHCQCVLVLGNYAALNGVMYCKPHFKQLFAAKGNYDEGFGKEKHTKKWDAGEGPVSPRNQEGAVSPRNQAGATSPRETEALVSPRAAKDDVAQPSPRNPREESVSPRESEAVSPRESRQEEEPHHVRHSEEEPVATSPRESRHEEKPVSPRPEEEEEEPPHHVRHSEDEPVHVASPREEHDSDDEPKHDDKKDEDSATSSDSDDDKDEE